MSYSIDFFCVLGYFPLATFHYCTDTLLLHYNVIIHVHNSLPMLKFPSLYFPLHSLIYTQCTLCHFLNNIVVRDINNHLLRSDIRQNTHWIHVHKVKQLRSDKQGTALRSDIGVH